MARKELTAAFLAAEGLVYVLFLSQDLDLFSQYDTVPLKYAGILLCLAFALLSCVRWLSLIHI